MYIKIWKASDSKLSDDMDQVYTRKMKNEGGISEAWA